MTNRGHDDTPTARGTPPHAGYPAAIRRDAAHAVHPRPAFVSELELHLRRQPPPQRSLDRQHRGGFRALVLAAIVALTISALALGVGMLRAATAPGTATPTNSPVAPTSTIAVGSQHFPAGASTVLSFGIMAGTTAWVPTWLVDPTVVYLLLMLGAMGVLLEMLHPGAFVPGIVGGAALLLGGLGLLALPLNWVGFVLLLLAFALVVTDIQASTHGALTLAAIVVFVPGSLLLFNSTDQTREAVALPAVLALTALLGAFGLGVGALVAHTHAIPPYRYALPERGMTGTTVGPLGPSGVVQVAGQLWSARSDAAPIAADQPVLISEREGLTLVVQPLAPGTAGESEFPNVDC